jgi:hypothetical protein
MPGSRGAMVTWGSYMTSLLHEMTSVLHQSASINVKVGDC